MRGKWWGKESTYPARTAVAVHILLEPLNAFVEVVVVVRAYIDEDAVAENVAQVLLARPIVRDVAGKVEGFPVLHCLVIDLSSDFVPGLSRELVYVIEM